MYVNFTIYGHSTKTLHHIDIICVRNSLTVECNVHAYTGSDVYTFGRQNTEKYFPNGRKIIPYYFCVPLMMIPKYFIRFLCFHSLDKDI